jgi:hypothetical protein
MADKVKLVELEGATSRYIDAEITAEGDLLLSGQDIGEAPREVWHEEEYEYWLTVKAADKDRVLLALLEKLYAGNASVISELKHYLESKDIPCEFFNYF